MSELINRLLLVPHIVGEGGWDGADCWGIIELWYQERFGIELSDRSDIPPGPEGLQKGFDNAEDWLPVDQPQNDDLVVMRSRGLEHGHVGIFWNNTVIHSEEYSGCVAQPIAGRIIRPRISCFLRYKDIG